MSRKYICEIIDLYTIHVLNKIDDMDEVGSNKLALYWNKDDEPNEYIKIDDADHMYINVQKRKGFKEIKIIR